jgi:hypothetical protein
MREEKEMFYIKIIDREILLVPRNTNNPGPRNKSVSQSLGQACLENLGISHPRKFILGFFSKLN